MLEGLYEGRPLGDKEGTSVGISLGSEDGAVVGTGVGNAVGSKVTPGAGAGVGRGVGRLVGPLVGEGVGALVGLLDSEIDGALVGAGDGNLVGSIVTPGAGGRVSRKVGRGDGARLGNAVGRPVGDADFDGDSWFEIPTTFTITYSSNGSFILSTKGGGLSSKSWAIKLIKCEFVALVLRKTSRKLFRRRHGVGASGVHSMSTSSPPVTNTLPITKVYSSFSRRLLSIASHPTNAGARYSWTR